MQRKSRITPTLKLYLIHPYDRQYINKRRRISQNTVNMSEMQYKLESTVKIVNNDSFYMICNDGCKAISG